MNPAVVRAALEMLADWRREAEGSRAQQAGYQRMADEHGRDAEQAEAAATELEVALRNEGIEL